jgi:hypothetical protein
MSAHTLTDARYLSATETSKIIRTALKATYPTVKFSVRTESRGTINIYWTDGPSTARVEKIANQFEGKGFDGMIDLEYHINGWLLNGKIVGTRCHGTEGSRGCVPAWGLIAPHDDCELVSFGAGYIFTRRDLSPKFMGRLVAQVAAYWGIEAPAVETSKYDSAGYVKATPQQDSEAMSHTNRWWDSLVHAAAANRLEYARD